MISFVSANATDPIFSDEFLGRPDAYKKAERLRKRHADRVPILVERCGGPWEIAQHFLALRRDMNGAEFKCMIRKYLPLEASQGLVYFVRTRHGVTPLGSETFGQLESEYANMQGLVHIQFTVEKCFGGSQ